MSIKTTQYPIKTFGENLPTVYFEKVELYEDRFEIELAMYNKGVIGERDNYEKYIEFLQDTNVKFYVTLVMDGVVAPLMKPSAMPPPMISVALSQTRHSDTDWEQNIKNTQKAYGMVTQALTTAAATMGLEPSQGLFSSMEATYTGNTDIVIYEPADPSLTYSTTIPNYYSDTEVTAGGTARIERLVNGDISPLSLIRRKGEYSLNTPTTLSDMGPVEIFEAAPAAPGGEVLPTVFARDLYTNPYLTVDPYSGGAYARGLMVDATRTAYMARGGEDIDEEMGAAVRSTTYSPPGTGGTSYRAVFEDENLNMIIGQAIGYPTDCNTLKFEMSDFDPVYEEIRRDDGTMIYKHMLKISNAFNDENKKTNTSTSGMTFRKWQKIIEIVPSVSLIAYSSLLDIDVGIYDPSNSEYNDLYTRGTLTPFSDVTDPVTNAIIGTPVSKIDRAMVSDATYEKVTEFGKVIRNEFEIFVNEMGHRYEGDAIQSINGIYYGVPQISYESIVKVFDDLLAFTGGDSVYSGKVSGQTSNDIRMAIMSLLQSHAEKPNLLPKLNHLRKSIVDTTEGTGVGRFYKKFKEALVNINQLVENRGIPLKKRFATSPVVTDRRGLVFAPWRKPEHPNNNPVLDFVNPWMSRVSKFGDRYMTSDAKGYETQLGDKMDIYINGYYFLDYEKALHQESNIAQVLDVKKLEHLYGRKITQTHFKLISNTVEMGTVPGSDQFEYSKNNTGMWSLATVQPPTPNIGIPSNRYRTGDLIPLTNMDPGHDRTYKGKITAWYNQPSGLLTDAVSVFVGKPKDNDDNVHFYSGQPQAYRDVPVDSAFIQDNELYGQKNREYSYTCLRNFEFVKPLTYNNKYYRLMCFEFQYVVPEQNTTTMNDPCYNDYLKFTTSVADDTEEIFLALAAHFKFINNIFKNYAEEAAQFCSYNNLDDRFNDFFADTQEARYASEPGNSPWFLVPVAYYTLQDLFANSFNGDRRLYLDEALKLAERINPRTGTLTNIALFLDALNEMKDKYFDTNNTDSPAYHYALTQISGVKPKFHFFGGESTRAGCTRFPLPTLQEALLTPVTGDLEFTAVAALADIYNNPMTKMYFGACNVPNTLCAHPNRGSEIAGVDAIAYFDSDDDTYRFYDDYQQNILFLEIKNHPDNYVNFPDFPWDRDSSGDIRFTGEQANKQTYKIAYYSQFTQNITKEVNQDFEVYWHAGDKKNSSQTVYRCYSGKDRTLLTSVNWNKAGRFTAGSSVAQNRTGATPKYTSMWLHAGMKYVIRWYIGGGSHRTGENELTVDPNTNHGDDDDNIADILWTSPPITIQVPTVGQKPDGTPGFRENAATKPLSFQDYDPGPYMYGSSGLLPKFPEDVDGDAATAGTRSQSNPPITGLNKIYCDLSPVTVDSTIGYTSTSGHTTGHGNTVYGSGYTVPNLYGMLEIPDMIAHAQECYERTYEARSLEIPAGFTGTEFVGIPRFSWHTSGEKEWYCRLDGGFNQWWDNIGNNFHHGKRMPSDPQVDGPKYGSYTPPD